MRVILVRKIDGVGKQKEEKGWTKRKKRGEEL